jgi:carbon storage regulator
VIGDGLITIEVTDIRGDQVRIGITAPREMNIHREEVQAKIDRDNRWKEGPV